MSARARWLATVGAVLTVASVAPASPPAPRPSPPTPVPPPVRPPAPRPAGNLHAVLVGVNEYDHPRLTPLKYAVADVTELGGVLRAAGYGVTLMTDATGRGDPALAPTKANVEQRLRAVLGRCKRGDSVLVGLAGHGVQFEGQKDSYFCPADARPLPDRTDTLVSLSKVYEELDGSFAGVKVLLVDACRDDPTAGRNSRGVDADTAPPPPRGVAALFSCSAGERAFEHDSLGHGIFFHHVIRGLRGEARNGRGAVTFNALSDYVADQVVEQAGALIGGGARQRPHQKGESIGGSPVLIPAGPAAGGPAAGPLPKKD